MLAYFDCFSGISGDMTLGAFIDLGVPVEWLKDEIRRLPLTGFDLTTEPVVRHGLRAQNVRVDVKDKVHPKNYTAIKSLIKASPLSEPVKTLSLDIFKKIAGAESAIHGLPVGNVHFHEVGGIDAIVDIVGTALCIEYLGITHCAASRLPLGGGFVRCHHGTLPVPAPATIAILKDIPVCGSDVQHELVTPTGAAIAATLARSFGPIPAMRIAKIGYGAGKRDLESRPNLLRVMIGTPVEEEAVNDLNGLSRCPTEEVTVVETAIDDMNPELFGFLMQRLFEDGALDVTWTPIYMKKNRPGTQVQVICRPEQKEAVIHRILSETTSLGVRYNTVFRRVLARETVTIQTSFGALRTKRIIGPDGENRLVPEYEVLKEIALQTNLPIRTVYDRIAREIQS